MIQIKKTVSCFRSMYMGRFVFRCFCLLAAGAALIFTPEQYSVMYGWNFFKEFSFFHVLWVIWMIDMFLQLIPCRKYLPLGSQKFLPGCFKPLKDFSVQKLKDYIVKCRWDALKICAAWLLLTAVIGAFYFSGFIDGNMLLFFTVVFYVCDLICVLFWCPFRVLFMKNRCCTTCRIFNWDHVMMFSPIVYVPGFYTWSLCFCAACVLAVWEIFFALRPERFWEGSNEALKCRNCTDRLCGGRASDIPSENSI